ncbi:MAG: hypothetical protein IVW56_12000 [Candidatus Binataceae bacterium]|nr:hypothetical protein [Candidatus Binataceae bacterium]
MTTQYIAGPTGVAHGALIAIILIAVAAGASGCSLFHHESPQQKFLDALNRGNAAEASQMWLTMSPESRANLSHSQGLTPNLSPEEIQAQVLRHEKERAAAEGDDTESAMGDSDDGDVTAEQIETPAQDDDRSDGKLSNLPSYNPPGSTETAPESDSH